MRVSVTFFSSTLHGQNIGQSLQWLTVDGWAVAYVFIWNLKAFIHVSTFWFIYIDFIITGLNVV